MVYPFLVRDAESGRPMGVVSVNEATDAVEGVMISEDFRTPPPAEYDALPSDWKPVKAAFRALHDGFRAEYDRPVVPGAVMHCLYFTSVRPAAQKQGVMKSLWDESLRVARDYGFRKVVAEASTEDVRHVLEDKLAFRKVYEVPYDKWKFEGYPIFKELKEHRPDEWRSLWIGIRNVNSDLYV
jgi:GNAT superfamily N-acetyltransferase